MGSMITLMPFLNIRACQTFQVETQIKNMNLNMSLYVTFKFSKLKLSKMFKVELFVVFAHLPIKHALYICERLCTLGRLSAPRG